ncbi:PQQ-dependent dehydrogenase, methanol/ethanol family [Kordiimonas pumila]|uniref:PQQ-dependent dehydrogenase, methanol/ethanol family n=1 Tax=Kordiimonas pumila TaxID=2161677 RepID=A0ABV7D5E6_9PROT|nr:PQQ-dependent dehydrogenase, methanol/ethanol family [Kordiimonas pumila]
MRWVIALVALYCIFLQPAWSEDWPSYGLNPEETRFSNLTDINLDNIGRLGFAWSFENFVVRGRTHRGNEATPLMVAGTLYFSGPWSVVYALDARTGTLIWQYDPDVAGQAARSACCDVISRGVAYTNDRIIAATFDGYLVSLNAQTGTPVWRTDTFTDRSRNYSITGAPRIAGDLVLIGNSGGEFGVRGYVSAYHILDGSLAWRFYTVPGVEPDISDVSKMMRNSWSINTDWSYAGGGTVWDSIVYDTEMGRVYIGVGNGSPWPAWERSPGGGDNLFLSSLVALDAKTGAYIWHYQTTPADSWDYTATQQITLAHLAEGNSHVPVLIQAPKNGYFYVIDRRNGRLISAEPYTKVTWSKGIDPDTKRPILNEEAIYSGKPGLVRPAHMGGHNWQPMAYNPDAQVVFLPVLEEALEYQGYEKDRYKAGEIRVKARVKQPSSETSPLLGDYGEGVPHSVLKAWDVALQKEVWSSDPMPWWAGGVLATAGGLVFQGGADGYLRAYNAEDGTLVAALDTGSAIMAAPITYRLDGEQYIAVLAGFGGGAKTFPSGSAPLQFENRERLLVFKLDGKQIPKPPSRAATTSRTSHSQTSFDFRLASRGQKLFSDHCSRCHAFKGVPANIPSLWSMPPELYDTLESIVLRGSMSYAGMPMFADSLDSEDIKAIREYLLFDLYRERKKQH